MKKTFYLLSAVLCAMAMMAGCKGGGTSAELEEAGMPRELAERTPTEADSLSQKEMPEIPFYEDPILPEGPIDTTGLDTMTFIFCEIDAEFPGSEDSLNAFLHRNIHYPKDAKEKKIEGTVYLTFIIEKDGSISNIRVLRSPSDLLSQEAIRLVKAMPKWKPATQYGYAVRQQNNLPIRFFLDKIK